MKPLSGYKEYGNWNNIEIIEKQPSTESEGGKEGVQDPENGFSGPGTDNLREKIGNGLEVMPAGNHFFSSRITTDHSNKYM